MSQSGGAAETSPAGATRRSGSARWRWPATLGFLLVLSTIALVWPSAEQPSARPQALETPTAPVTSAQVVPQPEHQPSTEPPAATPDAASAPPVGAPSSAPAAAPNTAATARPTVRPTPPPVVRVRIPALAIDAPVLQMGIDAAGVMEIPQSPTTVAWYGFSATPGSAGNAVMAGHVTWGGARAVFNQLQALRSGDVIEVQTSEGGIRYSVQRTYLIRPEDADIASIVGPRDGPQTLTLITCGGSFDSSVREYDHRVIVFATRV